MASRKTPSPKTPGPQSAGPKAPGRKPAARQPLTPERILQASLALVEQDGLAAFSTRRLGQRLGCEAMSIYHHYPSKHHLLDAMVDHAIGSMQWPAHDQPAHERLRQAMYAYREMAHRFPALFPLVAVHRLNTPTGVRFIESVLALVQAVVPQVELAARHFRTLGYFLVGAALDETSGYARGPSAAEPVDGSYIARECPRLATAAPFFQASQWDTTFELGVQAMLEAMQRDAKATA